MEKSNVLAFRGAPEQGWRAGTNPQYDKFNLMELDPRLGKLLRYPWNFIQNANNETIRESALLHPLGSSRGSMHDCSTLIRSDNIYIAEYAILAPGVVLDGTLGPIVIDEYVTVGANAVIEGPTYVGPHSQIKPLAHIRGSCFGEECRIGGEVTNSILQGYSNKQHAGFLGHSFIGEWCNLGSGTETSNLKNNYSNVKVQIGDSLIDSGTLFVGLTMGDHSKTAIGTVLNTGTVVGVACILYGAGFPPRFIPSFHWGGAEKLTRQHFKPSIETATAVMQRRNLEFSAAQCEVLNWIYQNRSQISR